ncbi:MAG: OmpA family protein [Marinosulfonomonas sp.]|nr:OmpA family protein [Marinosulfonomonas sp.]
MHLARIMPPVIALVTGCVLALMAAVFAADMVETRTQADVSRVLSLDGHNWVAVDVDGLQVILSGFAPDEATRFRALSGAGTIVDASRVIDMMDVTIAAPIAPPRFSIEILRNDNGISLIGLIPALMNRETVVNDIHNLADGAKVTDLLDVADFEPPAGWDTAVAFGLKALALLPRSKISISAERVELKAISDSVTEKRRLETELAKTAPDQLRIAIDISAPRPVITPYTLRFLMDDRGVRFDACSTDTEKGRETILTAAITAGLQGKSTCTIGLGVPSPNWDLAVATGIKKLAELGGGSITFSDADVTLVALDTATPENFDRITGELKAALPDVFSLHAILPEPVIIDGTGANNGPPEFVATRSPEGLVHLRGRISDERTRIATESYAHAQFGSKSVTGAMRLDPDLPSGWSTRVLASLASLSLLNHGSVVTQPDVVDIRGTTGNPDARAEIARILSEKLGETANFQIAVVYEEKLDPLANIPTPQECVAQINQVLSIRQITFAPSSADIDHEARDSIDNIAEIMKSCVDVAMEVGGHTDSQGREIMNQTLSQGRAEAVVNSLLARRILTSNLTAIGYGEAQPIADNKTEEGREANRRIEFKLVQNETQQPVPQNATGGEEEPTQKPANNEENADEQN